MKRSATYAAVIGVGLFGGLGAFVASNNARPAQTLTSTSATPSTSSVPSTTSATPSTPSAPAPSRSAGPVGRAAPSAAAYPREVTGGVRYSAFVLRWIDGDTPEVLIASRIAPDVVIEDTETVRLLGIDTPETKGATRAAGLAATAAARALAPERSWVVLDVSGRDKYGRSLGVLYAGGRDVAGALIADGHGRQYDGGAR